MKTDSAFAMLLVVAGLAGILRWKEQCPPVVRVDLDVGGSIAWKVNGTEVAVVTEPSGFTPWLALGRSIPLNESSATDLVGIRGIGPAKAEAIVAYRSSNGPFARLSDVQRVKGIGPKTAAQLAHFVDVGVMSGLSPAAP